MVEAPAIGEVRDLIAQWGCPFNPERHELTPCAWVISRKAMLGLNAPSLFVYRHRIHNTFVLALWLRQPHSDGGYGGVMAELKVMGPFHPDGGKCPEVSNMEGSNCEFGMPSYGLLQDLCRTQSEMWESYQESQRKKLADKQRKRVEDRERREGYIKMLQKRMNMHRRDDPDRIADIEGGFSAWANPESAGDLS